MKRLLIITAMAAMFGCGPAASRSEEAVQTGLVSVLDRWYASMERGDSAGTVAPLTDRFLLLEDTLPLSGLELAREIGHPDSGARPWRSARSGYRTRVQGDVAWTTLDNHETQLDPSGAAVCSADFIETVVFVSHGGQWLIDRYHAAARRRWSC
jgi:SnoaL-like domain